MEFLIPLMPMFAALPIAVAAVVIARMWIGRRGESPGEIETRIDELRAELEAVQEELRETQERVEFAERLLADPHRREPLPPPGEPPADRDPPPG